MQEQFVQELDQFYQENIKKPLEKFNGEQEHTITDELVQVHLKSEERKNQKKIEAEELLEQKKYSEDPEINKQMYEVFKE